MLSIIAAMGFPVGGTTARNRHCLRAAGAVALALACGVSGAGAQRSGPGASAASISAAEAAELRNADRGIYVAFCPSGEPVASEARRVHASVAMANHAGWPPDQCLKMDKGPPGRSHTLLGLRRVHNWLLGGYGNDTVYAGEMGDVIWGDYNPAGQSEAELDRLHGGAGADWIYSSHGYNEIWTGAGNDHLALVYGHGVIYCNGPGLKTLVMRYLPQNRPWRLVGCDHKVIVPYRA